MVNYVTKSISIFSLLCFILLISCQRDSAWTTPPTGVIPIAPVTVVSTPIEPPVVIPPPVIVTPVKVLLCPVGMVYIKSGNFCIDQYEWPNVKGAYPDFALTAYQAEDMCKNIEKRLCTHTEWVQACIGSQNLSYGYSNNWQRDTCNDSIMSNYLPVDWNRMGAGPIAWKKYAATLYKGVKSGSKEACYSIEEDNDKVYDMIGNVREWVKDPAGLNGYSFESSFWYGTMVGPAGCGFVIRAHAAGFASYEVGTRCCEDVK